MHRIASAESCLGGKGSAWVWCSGSVWALVVRRFAGSEEDRGEVATDVNPSSQVAAMTQLEGSEGGVET